MKVSLTSGGAYEGQTLEGIERNGESIEGCELIDCRLNTCRFSGRGLTGCSFVDCTFTACDLTGARLDGSRFVDTLFERSKLVGVDWTQVRSDWPPRVRFKECHLSYASFFGMKLHEMELIDCVATDVDFRSTDLTGASLRRTDLERSLFTETDLSRADLRDARNYAIDIRCNRVRGARFSLPEALSLLRGLDIVVE